MRKNAQIGDEITTIGGICGRIVAIKEESDSVIIETGTDRNKVKLKRWAISTVDTADSTPSTPVREKKEKEKEKETTKELKEANNNAVEPTKEETNEISSEAPENKEESK